MATDSTVISSIRYYVRSNELTYDYVKNELDMNNLVTIILGYAARSSSWYEQQRDQMLKLLSLPKSRRRYS